MWDKIWFESFLTRLPQLLTIVMLSCAAPDEGTTLSAVGHAMSQELNFSENTVLHIPYVSKMRRTLQQIAILWQT